MGHRRKLRARGKRNRATAGPLKNLLLDATSASRVVASSASKTCRVVRSEFRSALILSRSVAIPSMPALVASRCISAPTSVSRVHLSSFPAISSSAFAVPSSTFEACDSFFESSSFLLSALISRFALHLASAFAAISCRLTSYSVKVLWGG